MRGRWNCRCTQRNDVHRSGRCNLTPSSWDFCSGRQFIINLVIKFKIQTIFPLTSSKLFLCCWHRSLRGKTQERHLCCCSSRTFVRMAIRWPWLTQCIWILISWLTGTEATAGHRGKAGIWPFPGVGTETVHALVAWDIAHWKTTPTVPV